MSELEIKCIHGVANFIYSDPSRPIYNGSILGDHYIFGYASYGVPGIFDGSRYMATYDECTRNAVELWGEDNQDYLYPYNASLAVLESEEYASVESDI